MSASQFESSEQFEAKFRPQERKYFSKRGFAGLTAGLNCDFSLLHKGTDLSLRHNVSQCICKSV
jgi:hypothetical protein